jgi:hypothetical protein
MIGEEIKPAEKDFEQFVQEFKQFRFQPSEPSNF